jgi:hypothetical protein
MRRAAVVRAAAVAVFDELPLYELPLCELPLYEFTLNHIFPVLVCCSKKKSGNPEEWTEGNWTNEPGLPGCSEAGR